MGDSTKPSAGGEGENLFHLPLAKQHGESGKQEVIPRAPVSNETNIEAAAEVVAAISGMQNETAQQIDEKIGQLVKVDFRKGRQNGLSSSHAKPGKPKAKAKPGLRAVKPKPRPKKIEGLGLTAVVPTPTIDKISGGKRTKISTSVMNDREVFSEIGNYQRLQQIADIMEEEFSKLAAEGSVMNEAVAGRELFALRQKEYITDDLKRRDADTIFFQDVAKIVLQLWPSNWKSYVNDRSIRDMMRMIRDKDAVYQRVLGLIKTWADARKR